MLTSTSRVDCLYGYRENGIFRSLGGTGTLDGGNGIGRLEGAIGNEAYIVTGGATVAELLVADTDVVRAGFS